MYATLLPLSARLEVVESADKETSTPTKAGPGHKPKPHRTELKVACNSNDCIILLLYLVGSLVTLIAY